MRAPRSLDGGVCTQVDSYYFKAELFTSAVVARHLWWYRAAAWPQEADPRRRKAPAPRLPYRTFEGVKGTEIRVGRTARDNDALSLKLCNGNDLWLHTADAPGSHVVLRTSVNARGKGKGKSPEADPEELLDAAHLAVHFSPLRGAEKADVHVCPCKQVHKPKGAKPGLVTLSGGRTLQVRLEPERLDRLLRADRRS